ncbi:metal-dependent hydrolase [Halobacteria archaeon AArc-curdl1]|uniref:Metal-dependent hydrolase n=1 Tax=Natronosalvus hydrolyticus TaxID=2979988 RepID=A0AAP2Z5G3_9EURY|nr:metal-dependent hydrolase [Halobacteria archaeon AArc-curdl1]
MQPIVHLSVGYLCYAAYTRWRRGERPRGVPVLVVLVGAGLPDLLDKPLAAAGIVDVGRTVGHSLFTAVIVMTIVWQVAARRNRRPLAIAFIIGYASHIVTDVPWHVLSGDIDELGFLLWPVTEMPAYSGVKYLGTVGGVEITTLWLEAVIFVAGVGLWWRDGKPGLETLKNAVVD